MITKGFAKRVYYTRLLARTALGLVWVYEGLVPKMLFAQLHPEQTRLVASSGLAFGDPLRTLWWLGVPQILLGLALLGGWYDRAAALVATAFMGVLMVLVATGRPEMLTDPFGALAKDLCLIACAAVLWILPARVRGVEDLKGMAS